MENGDQSAAVCRDLAKRVGCFCLFATHFHELTALVTDCPTMRNVHTEAIIDDQRELTLLYRVVDGVADKSFGVHIAGLVRFPPHVIQTAWTRLSQLERTDEQRLIERLKAADENDLRRILLATGDQ
uniref:DNA mismatch repair proteins mutS family domain-containing protein n=1 Tax=Plectus sambesii TaxID=2011161 RepID=A0A914XLG4_9BILA